MRHFAVVGLLLVSTIAHADPKAIEKAVKTNLAELAKLSDDDKLVLTKDASVIHSRAGAVDMTERDGCVTGAVANAMYGCLQGDIKHLPGAIVSGVAGDVGWFQIQYTSVFDGSDPDGNSLKSKTKQRAGGIAVKDGAAWKLATVMYVEPISDKDLLKSSDKAVPKGEPTLKGDTKLAGVVAGWFKTGFAPNAATAGTLIASGTSPTEFKSAAAGKKLATGWDKLKLAAVTVDAKLYAGGKIGWVVADVRWPRKNGKSAVAMQLAAVVIPDGDGWKWVSLMYQPEFEPGR